MSDILGATPQEWASLSLVAGITEDLLPVVGDFSAKISPRSGIKEVGKTPCLYASDGVMGIPGWTQKHSTQAEVDKWSKNPDYGICIQTRNVRAIDIDIPDVETSAAVQALIAECGLPPMPLRYREGTGKCLLAFRTEGELSKRIIRLSGKDIIELLAAGQQFIAVGTHKSGTKYQWADGVPTDFPEVSIEQLEEVWSRLEKAFAVESSVSQLPSKGKVLHAAIEADEVAQEIIAKGALKKIERDGRMHITCPFESEHTSESSVSATTYFPANTGGYQFGHFDCRHAHCESRTDDEFKAALGIAWHDPFDDFAVLDPLAAEAEALPVEKEGQKGFNITPAHEFAIGKPVSWIVKNVLPQADLGVIFGESGSGKTFFILDLVTCIAKGTEWRGNKVKQRNVVYIAAEGSGGMRNRLKAMAQQSGIVLDQLPIGILADAPNFMEVSQVKDVIRAVKTYGDVGLVVVDTFAQVMAGANENAGEDVGKALKHCREIHKRTGAMVILVHHAGKDSSKGARGWSGLRAASDVEIEVNRADDDRSATVTKLKDGQDGATFGFKLNTVQVDIDEDGDAVTSCVVEYVEGGKKVAAVKEKKSSRGAIGAGIEKMLVDALQDIGGVTGKTRMVEAENFVMAKFGVTGKSEAAQRTKVSNAMANLVALGLVQNNDGWLSLVR